MTRTFKAGIVAVVLGAITPAVAEDTYILEEVAGWQIGLDTTSAGCFAFGEYEDGVFFKFGFNAVNSTLEFIIGSKYWNSIEYQKAYDLSVQFGGRQPWRVPSIGGRMQQGAGYLSSETSNPEVIQQFMKAKSMRVSYLGREIALLSLGGSYRAFQAVQECQRAVLEKLSRNEDRADDPFRNRGETRHPESRREYRISDPFIR